MRLHGTKRVDGVFSPQVEVEVRFPGEFRRFLANLTELGIVPNVYW